MGLTSSFQRLYFLILLFSLVAKTQADANGGSFSIKDYGATGDGKTDDSKALLDAWNAACQWSGSGKARMTVPQGTYLAGTTEFKGPCKGSGVAIQLDGTVKASPDLRGDSWMVFSYNDGLAVSGSGQFDGQGESAWTSNQCGQGGTCNFPVNIRFNFLTNATIRGITSLNSKYFHINVLGCQNFKFQNVKVSASGSSINTDGIHIGRSNGVEISNSVIGTGDDCVSLGDGSANINVTGVTCGPGHGFAVGSLGKYDKEEPVNKVLFKNCSLTGTMFGIRIKSWPASYTGSVSDITYDDITMNNVSTPILLDQQYCPWNKCNNQLPSKVKISSVTFNNIRGTSATKEAIKIACSPGTPCDGVKLSGIKLEYSGADGPATSTCTNAQATVSGDVVPATCTS